MPKYEGKETSKGRLSGSSGDLGIVYKPVSLRGHRLQSGGQVQRAFEEALVDTRDPVEPDIPSAYATLGVLAILPLPSKGTRSL